MGRRPEDRQAQGHIHRPEAGARDAEILLDPLARPRSGDRPSGPSTLAKYESTFRLHVDPILGSMPFGRITRRDVSDLVAVTEAQISAHHTKQ